MEKYDPKFIEKKWQSYWEENKTFSTPKDSAQENNFYVLPQLPYPSGSGLHVGHAEVYTACDIYARYQRMKGRKVLQVFGLDSFGLPAENYAIKTNVHPKQTIDETGANFVEQVKKLGASVDWDRFVRSSDPEYYKFTQWFFLLMYERGLAYRKTQAVNWCDSCKTVLANAQVVDGHCERCDTVVVQKDMEQWYLKITDYAEKLLEGLDRIDWPEETKKRQKDWIGKSEGAEIQFKISNSKLTITVFTTRPDTLFGATYMVLAPEGQYVQELKGSIENWEEVESYILATSKKTELERQTQKEKTGVELKGVKAVNPANGEEIPIWIADYVIATYGTGAIMAVPAHDERDFEFATKFGLDIKKVVALDINTAKKGEELRNGIYGIFEKDGKILVQYEKRTDLYRLPGGTQEKGETDEQTLLREFTEETGYTNVIVGDIVGQVGVHIPSTKNQKLFAFVRKAHIVTLENEDRIPTIGEDENAYEYLMLTREEALQAFEKNKTSSKFPHDTGEGLLVKYYFDGDEHCFSEYGIAINSDFLNGFLTVDAKSKMIDWLEEKNIGKRKIQYKLRDWSVSRQRFWGAPLPMLVNEQLATNKKQYVFIHGRGGSVEKNFWPWLKKELEQRGHSVVAIDLEPKEPKADENASFLLQHVDFTTNTVLVAHSHGGPVSYRVLEQLSHKIEKLVLVDPVVLPEFNDKRREDVEQSTHWKFDFEKIKENVEDITIIADNTYPIIKKEHLEELATKLDARFVIASANLPHFDAKEEQVILEESLILGIKPVPFSDLPVLLPEDVDFKPTGQSPLTYSKTFQEGVEEKYGEGWKREVNTLDTFMCSSWYFFRYLDPHNEKEFASKEALKTWMPVDFYLGGPEHVNGHLLYSRFFTKVLFDAGYIDFDEPFKVHRHQGLILGPDGRKMSKRWGNVINPSDVVDVYGADTMRMYEMFMGPLEDDKPWDESGVKGVRRFLDRVWKLQDALIKDEEIGNWKIEIGEIDKETHKVLKKVGDDFASLSFNTAIAKMMELINIFYKAEKVPITNYRLLITMLAPFAPHMAEELWQRLGNNTPIAFASWPQYDETKLVGDTLQIAVQVNGKVRTTIEISPDANEEDVKALAMSDEHIKKWLDGNEPKKVIYVKGKIVNVVV